MAWIAYTRLIDRRERIYEARFGDHRMAYIEHDGEIVMLNGWRKKGQDLDPKEAARAKRLARECRAR